MSDINPDATARETPAALDNENTPQTDDRVPLAQELQEDKEDQGGYLDENVSRIIEPTGSRDLEAVYDVPVQVTAVIGRASLPVNELFKLRTGKVVELGRKVGEPVDILVNNRLVARGEVVMTVNDTLGITMTEIVRTETSD